MIKPYALVLGVLFLLLTAAPAAYGGEEVAPPRKNLMSDLMLFAVVEGIFAANSGLATLSPRIYGASGLLLIPFGFTQGGGSRTNLAEGSLFAAICLYNLFVPHRRDFSNSQVFVHNMIGWHLFLLGVGAVSLLVGDEERTKQPAFSFDFNVRPDGGMFMAQYRF